MTQDYKATLLDYLTGNIVEEVGVNVPVFNEQTETLNKNIVTNVEGILANQENAQSVAILGKLYNESYSTYLIYGYYLDNSSNYYGFIYLVDDELNEIQMITEFTSGTKLFPITALNQDENNNLYGLSHEVGGNPGTTRVLLLNNIFASGLLDGTYKCILRNDYIVPYSYGQTLYRQNRIIKSPDSSTYYLIMRNGVNTAIVKFTINVGSTNDWETYSINKTITSQFAVNLDKSSGEEALYLYAMDSNTTSYYYEYKLENGVITQDKQIQLPGSSNFVYSQVFFKSTNEIYLSSSDDTNNKNVVYRINDDNLIEIYSLPYYESGGVYTMSFIELFEINGGVFAYIKYRQSTTNDISIGYIKNDEITLYSIGSSDNTPQAAFYDYVDFYYKNAYNLVNLYIPIYGNTDTTVKLTFDYNYINYNGVSYNNIDSISPTKARLYDGNDKMIFARNLYNKTINANTTVSTINIPNTNLNGVTIATQNLIGATNYDLVSNEEDITKNIYENLNINFYNTLRMVNENNPNDSIFNQLGSNRINSSVSSILDYENAKATKLKINYSDETFRVIEIQPSQITYSNGVYTYTFMVYVSKNIQNIQIISNDELTVYQTITGTFEVGKYYLITQDVRIGG